MVKLRMAQHIGDAAKFVEQGRILLAYIVLLLLPRVYKKRRVSNATMVHANTLWKVT